jgi:acyl-coenzyme A thioesterase PaaI-like protein
MAFQDQIRDNYCWGCGADNDAGLQLRSEWDGDVAVAAWTPWPDPEIWYATASLKVDYLRPTPLDAGLLLRAVVVDRRDRRTVVECTLAAADKERARAVVEAVRVPSEWKHGGAGTP